MKGNNCLVFFVNGKKVIETNPDPECTLLTFLRQNLRLCGTKLGCGEGGCGACTVMISRIDRKSSQIKHLAVNACLAPLCGVHGMAVTTVEGIGSTRTRLHPVQERIAKAHGSQCGFCTPGIVMSMYALLRSLPKPSMEDLETTFQGNLCRCTGYRPILEGYKTFTKEYECLMGEKCCRVNGNTCPPNVSDELFDRTEFTTYHPSQEPIFPAVLQVSDQYDKEELLFNGPRVTWYRPTNLEDLLCFKSQHPNAKIVVGNTEIGIDVKIKNYLYPILVHPSHVEELNVIKSEPGGIRIGAAVSLSEVEQALTRQIHACPIYETRIYKQIVEMLNVFAGKQIRNVASIGGNIMTGSKISDIIPILMAAQVVLEVMSLKRGRRFVKIYNGFFTGYRKNIIRPDEVLVSILVPKTEKNQHTIAFKQARRRHDDIAIVNFALNVQFYPDTDQVKNAQMAFGGVQSSVFTPIKICQAMNEMKWNQVLVEKVVESLSKEFVLPCHSRTDGNSYRKCLVLSLFFKGYLAIAQELDKTIQNKVLTDSLDESGAVGIHRYAPKSSQFFEQPLYSQADTDPVGRPIVALSAFKQASGEAVYCDDMPRLENELHMAFVYSSRASAIIVSIDESEALRLEGVYGFLSAKDLSKEQNLISMFTADEEIFASSRVYCKGQIIAAILAESQAIAQRAARMVQVEYVDLLPVIITIEDAIKHNSYLAESPTSLIKGDVDEAFKRSEHVIEGTCRMGGQEHFYLETQVTVAAPRDVDELEVYSSCQHVTHLQQEIARMLSIPESKITAKVKRIGGGFGGKEDRSFLVGLPVALAAFKYKRPVRCMLDRTEDMQITGCRHPYLMNYKVGCTKDGLLTALEVDCYSNGGYCMDASWLVLRKTLLHIVNAYFVPNIRLTGRICKTNLPSNTAFRGFGAPQGCFVAEHFIRDVARETGKDYTEIAFRNLYKNGDITPYNMIIENCTLQRAWKECLEKSKFSLEREKVTRFNAVNRYKKRGIAMVPAKHGITKHPVLGHSSALVHIYQDGSILLSHGGIEMGQGLYTKMIQVASRALGVPHDLIHTSQTSTDTTANLVGTAGSLGSDLNGMAVMDACNKLNKRLAPIKEKHPNESWTFWIRRALYERVCLSATGYYKIEGDGYNWDNHTGTPFMYFTIGVGCSVVEVDCLTGDHQVLKTDIVMDAGSSLNPAIDIGQIEGAFMQGYGLFTLEEMSYSPNGDNLSLGPGKYKIPSFSDIPTEFNISLLTGAPNPKAVYSSKAIGEPPLFLSASVFFAIKDAIGAYRLENRFPAHFKLTSPATSARIRMACEDRFSKKVLESEGSELQTRDVML